MFLYIIIDPSVTGGGPFRTPLATKIDPHDALSRDACPAPSSVGSADDVGDDFESPQQQQLPGQFNQHVLIVMLFCMSSC